MTSSVSVAYKTMLKFKPSTHRHTPPKSTQSQWPIRYGICVQMDPQIQIDQLDGTASPLPPSLQHKHTLSMAATLGWEWGCLSLSCKGISEMMLADLSALFIIHCVCIFCPRWRVYVCNRPGLVLLIRGWGLSPHSQGHTQSINEPTAQRRASAKKVFISL